MDSTNLAWLIRRHGIEMTHLSGGSHIASILSMADMIAVLYADIVKYDAQNPTWEGRDRVILSKGHAGAALYSTLAECGFFPTEMLKAHYQNGSLLSGHVSHHVPGVELSTGSLGHGLSVGTGMAYALKKDKKDNRVYVILGDGECNEGSIWEAALFANHHNLQNLFVLIDHNKMQSMDYCEKTLALLDLGNKWRAFGWNVIDLDGANHDELRYALSRSYEKPTVVLAHTIKGAGIKFMENDILWHYRFPHDGWEYDLAVDELHKNKPNSVIDPYTPMGIKSPTPVPCDADIYKDHTTAATWHPDWQ